MNKRPMSEEHKAKLAAARDAARARKNAVNAEIIEEARPPREKLRHPYWREEAKAEPAKEPEAPKYAEIDPRDAELEALRERVAEFEAKREKAAHEHQKVGGERVVEVESTKGVQSEVKEALRELIREQMAETFPERQPVRKTTRESVRPNAAVGYDRDGNPVYRKRDQTADPFNIPEDLKDPSYDLQWCRASVFGQEDTAHQVSLQEQGWRFIQADSPRWRGRMMPSNYKGPIFRDGLYLMERPMVLTEEARQESNRKLQEQSKAQREQFGMALPQGFSRDTPSARAYTFARQGKSEPTPSNLKPDLHVTGGTMDIDA